MKKTLIKLSAIFLILGGALYVLVQFIHPADDIQSVSTSQWLLVSVLTALMGLVLFLGTVGHFLLYQDRIKILGTIGFILFANFWLLTMVFSFIESFVLPLLVETSPDFVEGMVGLFGSTPATVDLGVFPLLVNLAGIFYLVGGTLYGIGGIRGQLPGRMAYILLILGALATIAAGILGHPLDRILAFPMAAALVWLGWNVWQETEE